MYESMDVDQLVFAYQSGDQDAAMQLLLRYGYNLDGEPTRFLGKYYQLLVHGAYDLRDKDVRRFLQLYMHDGESRRVMTYHLQDTTTKKDAARVVNLLTTNVQKVEKEDVMQDLVLLFLDQAMKFEKKKKEVDFSGYLYNTYRYKVYHLLQKKLFSYDVLTQEERVMFDEDLIGEQGIEIKDEWFYEETVLKDEPELGLDWVQGNCHEVYKVLSVLERLIIKLAYDRKMTDEQIARQLGFHRNTIWKYRNEAQNKVEDQHEVLRKEGMLE